MVYLESLVSQGRRARLAPPDRLASLGTEEILERLVSQETQAWPRPPSF